MSHADSSYILLSHLFSAAIIQFVFYSLFISWNVFILNFIIPNHIDYRILKYIRDRAVVPRPYGTSKPPVYPWFLSPSVTYISLAWCLLHQILRYCKIVVTIEDVNDNYPFFPTWLYEGSVWQKVAVGAPIMFVHALDWDSDVNSKVEYRFAEANDKFAISDIGVISTKTLLDSSLGILEYQVIASNTEPMTVGEANSRERRTLIKIYVSELRPPQFTKSIFKASIPENSKPGTMVNNLCYFLYFQQYSYLTRYILNS